MPVTAPEPVPVPLSSFPGLSPQESAGRLINCYAEPLADPQQQAGAPKDAVVWRRTPGLTQFAMTNQSGYRGGLIVNNLSYEAFSGQALTVGSGGAVTSLGAFPGTKRISIARNQASNPDVVAVDLDNGAYVLNSAAVTAASIIFTFDPVYGNYTAGDDIDFTFTNPWDSVNPLPFTSSYTVTGAEGSVNTVIDNVVLSINPSLTGIVASRVGTTLKITQNGAIGNLLNVISFIDGSGGTTPPSPVSGNLSGGAGVPGAFTGAPTFYNGQGNLPQPNSVSFQDGYLFFTIGDNRVFATALNSLLMNALTYVTIESKSDVQLLRGIPYQGYMFFFTTGSCEVWNDQASPAPAFPYGRTAILTTGLIQPNAIAGYETGFDDLLWVAQDYGVWRLPQNTLAPSKVSPPDLDRAIEAAVRAGDTLEAGVHIFAGKKFWTIQSSTWSWQFNLGTGKWNERWSLQTSGAQGRWRGSCGHPAFSRWLLGDTQSGALLAIDDTNFNDATIQVGGVSTVSAPMLMRIESGVVDKFPTRSRVARADFHWVQGTGRAATNSPTVSVTGAAAGTAGRVRLAVSASFGFNTGDTVVVSGVLGTTEANGTWNGITTIDATHIEIPVTFANAYSSGGTMTNVTAPPANVSNPTVAISWADDGGVRWRGPSLRGIGPQQIIKTGRISVKNTGLTGVQGRRWRLDISDPVYAAFLKATQSDDPTEPS